MKISGFNIIEKLQKPNFWLCAIAVGLIIIQLDVARKFIPSLDALTIRCLFWSSILYLIWKKRDHLSLESDIISTLLGLLLIFILLVKSLSLLWFDSIFVKISALISFWGLALIASGIRGLKQYIQEFAILLLLLSESLILGFIDSNFNVSILAAKFSTFVLWYLGFPVSRQGVNVILPTGAIEIYPACSGLNAILILLQLSLLFILVFPIKIFHKIMLPIVAIFLGFVINIFRLVLMTLLVAAANHQGFEYWHGGAGSQIFSTFSILAFVCVCYWVLQQYKSA